MLSEHDVKILRLLCTFKAFFPFHVSHKASKLNIIGTWALSLFTSLLQNARDSCSHCQKLQQLNYHINTHTQMILQPPLNICRILFTSIWTIFLVSKTKENKEKFHFSPSGFYLTEATNVMTNCFFASRQCSASNPTVWESPRPEVQVILLKDFCWNTDGLFSLAGAAIVLVTSPFTLNLLLPNSN